MTGDIIEKLKASGLTGRSGSEFPTWQKWQAVRDAVADKKYVICNAAEGEPYSFKDQHILKNYPGKVVAGVKLAMETVGAKTSYIYINEAYYKSFKNTIGEIIKNMPIEFFKKTGGYLAGEETSILEAIEGKKPEPRVKPPFPTESGLWGKPTLINNVETLYWAAVIAENNYKHNKFYSIAGETENKGVFELPEKATIKQILEKTGNYPQFNFLVQVGGGAAGAILSQQELDQPAFGLACLIILNKEKIKGVDFMKANAQFLLSQNCDRCVPCREGLYRIKELLNQSPVNKKLLFELILVMEKTSLCPLGKTSASFFKTAAQKLL